MTDYLELEIVQNVEVRGLGDGGVSFLIGLSVIKDFPECRNAEASVLGEGSVFLLRDYLESKIF